MESSQVKQEGSTDSLQRQGSIRRVLPPRPAGDGQVASSAKMLDRRSSAAQVMHNYGQYFQEYTLLSEYLLLQQQKLSGMYVIPSAESPYHWFGVLFVRQGLYEGGVFRFDLYIPDTFPDGSCPHVIFQHPLFHPQVDANTGKLDLLKVFHRWKKNVNHIVHILLYLRKIFYKIEIASPSNVEAATLFQQDLDTFRARVEDCVKLSQGRLYDPPPVDDPHYLRFSPYDSKIHDPVRNSLLNLKHEDEGAKCTGLSWVAPDSLQPFSKS